MHCDCLVNIIYIYMYYRVYEDWLKSSTSHSCWLIRWKYLCYYTYLLLVIYVMKLIHKRMLQLWIVTIENPNLHIYIYINDTVWAGLTGYFTFLARYLSPLENLYMLLKVASLKKPKVSIWLPIKSAVSNLTILLKYKLCAKNRID